MSRQKCPAKVLLFRGVAIAPSAEREPLSIERKARQLALLKPQTGRAVEDLIEYFLEQFDGDDGGRHVA